MPPYCVIRGVLLHLPRNRPPKRTLPQFPQGQGVEGSKTRGAVPSAVAASDVATQTMPSELPFEDVASTPPGNGRVTDVCATAWVSNNPAVYRNALKTSSDPQTYRSGPPGAELQYASPSYKPFVSMPEVRRSVVA